MIRKQDYGFHLIKQLAKSVTDSEQVEKLANDIPQIKQLDENLHDKAIIMITINSAIIESFRDRPEIINF
ncbi:hypothetical protein EQU06_04380 [Lactobacillus sanfranciscensis]|uniref:hypothetical protein n=1 Tax=Fructilactobacillus sanfranciscensis TaxID=1625 RepID=UPI00031D971A|nr:hypothetical protein [Fructilactobacillus sanfranciscensis]NDR75758.1 hypothetical protein [Fructilactobacillus sanfranciscensis]NDR96225.1 hypothetical protein [Fructilactobacillus sanfranciscensis]NDS04602.1 hypothetical protein [Fructilactobacillus sanfranciscensis]